MNSQNLYVLNKRYLLLSEWVSTEKTYNLNLKIFKSFFTLPLVNLLEKKIQNDKKNLTIYLDLFKQLLKSLNNIIKLSEEFYKTLTSVFASWQISTDLDRCVGETLSSVLPYFKIYSIYVSIHSDVLYNYLNLKSNTNFKKLKLKISEIENSVELEGKTFESFLIQPIQRLPRYKMFLDSLIKETSESHKDYKSILTARTSLEMIISSVQIIDKINENRIICSKLTEILKIRVSKEKRFFLGKVYLKLKKYKALENKHIKEKYFGKKLSCFLFNDYFIVTKSTKILFKVEPKLTKTMRMHKGGWKEKNDFEFYEIETELKISTSKTNIILQFDDTQNMKEFFIVFVKTKYLDFNETSLEDMTLWAIETQKVINTSKIIKISTLQNELKNIEASKTSASL